MLRGKQAVITGASSGIGKATAKSLASLGAHVVLGCRNIEKGTAVAKEIISETGNKNIFVGYIDMTNFKSIVDFASRIDHCHYLVNNAGGIFKDQVFVNDIELTMCTNYIGPHLLTNLMLPKIEQTSTYDKSSECRIVFISSKLESLGTTGGDYTSWIKNGPTPYEMWDAYSNSKLCTMLNAFELSRRLTASNSKITVNAISPGIVNTNFLDFLPSWQRVMSAPIRHVIFKSPTKAADGIVYAVSSKQLNGITGKFLKDGKVIPSSDSSNSLRLANSVWDRTDVILRDFFQNNKNIECSMYS
jgi:NAD(P)-dependent dehydrogenase (short-subunit alcohol dehydrogenase family)